MSNVSGAITELQTINYIFQKNSIRAITDNGITRDYFTVYKDHFDYLLDFYNKYNQLPSKETFQGKFNDSFEWLNVTDPEEYLISHLREAKMYRDVVKDYNAIGELLKSEQTDKAISQMSAISQKFYSQSGVGCIDLIDNAKDRYNSYLERVNNPDKSFVTTGLKELDDVIGGWDMLNETAIISARTGVGKCLEKGTKILMADGTIKCVEDVVVGDRVQSLNRTNTVVALHNGVSNGYRIIPNKGDSFVVSSNHIMTFMKYKIYYDNSIRREKIDGFEIVDMSIEDYIKLSNHQKRFYKLYRPSVEYEKKQLNIPPYILGIWLGDGNCRDVTLTSQDDEIVCEWENFAKVHDAQVSKFNKKSKASYYRIHFGKGHFNRIDSLFREYNLLNNKHIPIDYLTSNRADRLELLAGLIDTDGYNSRKNNMYSITQKNYELSLQIAQLCRGLGFLTTFTKKYNKKYNRFYYTVSISNRLDEIPVRLSRKKIFSNGNAKRPYCLYGFTVKPVDRVEYYGFMCDGDERYLLADNTLTHNTWFLIYFAYQAAKAGLRVGYYSGEMESEFIGYRVDTFAGNIANGSLTHGNSEIKNQYETYLSNLSSTIKGHIYCITPDDKMFNGSVTVSKLKAFIEKYDLQMLCIDQFSLLDDEQKGKSVREQAINISKNLRALQRLKKIPILCAVQLNREDTEESGPSTRNIAESDRIGQDATTVLFIENKGDNVRITIGKSRNAKTGDKLTYMWNKNMGIMHYIPTDNDAKKGVDAEAIADSYNDTKSDTIF